LEREVYDFFGVSFFLHKNLKRILTDYGFLGNPMKKSFPLVGFLEYRFSDLFKSVVGEPIVLGQLFRNYLFVNPWID